MSCGPTIVVQKPRRPVTISRGEGRTTVVRDPAGATNVTRAERTTEVVRAECPLTVEKPTTRTLKLVTPGPQGPPGAPGGSIAPIDFAYGDAPRAVWTPESSGLLMLARLIILQAFNGVGAAIIVGTQTQPDAAMPSNYNDPSRAFEYENTPDIRLAAGESIFLTITPGSGATAGAGTLILGFLPN